MQRQEQDRKLAEGLALQCVLIILHAYAGVARMRRTERSKFAVAMFLSLAMCQNT